MRMLPSQAQREHVQNSSEAEPGESLLPFPGVVPPVSPSSVLLYWEQRMLRHPYGNTTVLWAADIQPRLASSREQTLLSCLGVLSLSGPCIPLHAPVSGAPQEAS